ncbi:sugar ABC transporter ATP-binding protein [Streptomyces sp. NPDC056190]|uniref:sugar ABC transporter ATP-binding protein n=1 Tax=unclassified Streptomyces TaxID=2593676 RepID=UPI0035D85442
MTAPGTLTEQGDGRPEDVGSGAQHRGIRLESISKTFGPTRVLHSVSLDFPAGRTTAVLGENGAGKSTLFKILSGFHVPDAGGRLIVDGTEHRLPLTPTSSADLGFAFVHQDLALAQTLSVAENVCVGALVTSRAGLVRWREQARQVKELLDGLGMDIDPAAPVHRLPQGERAVLAIARALYARGRRHSKLLVLDEPTANLTERERTSLFDAIRRVTARGTAVAFCTHRLEEVGMIADRVVVLRDGHLVSEHEAGDIAGPGELAAAIIGSAPQAAAARTARTEPGAPVLRAEGLRGRTGSPIDLTVHAGEIVGVTGRAGAGHDSLPTLLLGSDRTAGTLTVGERTLRTWRPSAALAAGLAVLPADRKQHSGVQSFGIRENLTLVSLRRHTRRGFVDRTAERHTVQDAMERYDVRPRTEPDRPLGTLSGGNQQKVLLAKWLQRPGLRCLVLHEPTQGVDVGARRALLDTVTALTEEGLGVLVVGSDHEELAQICDRVLVMSRGSVVGELDRPAADEISAACLGATTPAAASAATGAAP